MARQLSQTNILYISFVTRDDLSQAIALYMTLACAAASKRLGQRMRREGKEASARCKTLWARAV